MSNTKTINTERIRLECDMMFKDITKFNKEELKIKYEYLHNTSESLFDFILKQNNVDINIFNDNLNSMLYLIKDIQNNKISQYDASAVIGNKLAHKYIPDKFFNKNH